MREATSPLLLSAVILNGLVLALILARAGTRTPALRWLAALVAVLALRIVPYPLGFAGAYDRWKWLTFLPVDASLALGPLLWGYVCVLARGTAPSRVRWHFLPAVVQLLYQLIAFCVPQPLKGQYYQHVHVPIIEPIGLVLVLLSLVLYTAASWKQFVRWQRWMDDHLSNRESFRCGFVRSVLIALTAVTAIGLVSAAYHAVVSPLNYGERAPAMLAFGVLVYALGVAGLGQTGRRYPVIGEDAGDELVEERPAPEPIAATLITGQAPTQANRESPRKGRPPMDYAELGREWADSIQRNGWYRNPDLTLAVLAQQLNASPRSVSRVLREGLGVTFHEFVNGMRVAEVSERLADPNERRSTLVIALDAGFASKASFNRAFREATGTTPAAVRRSAESE